MALCCVHSRRQCALGIIPLPYSNLSRSPRLGFTDVSGYFRLSGRNISEVEEMVDMHAVAIVW